MFPLTEMPAIQQHPEDFRLLRRVPWTKAGIELPMFLEDPVGDEIPFVTLDTETTGLSVGTDKIIELGMVKGRISPSTGRVTVITAVTSLYEDPGFPIPHVVTEITGITDDMVRGKSIDPVTVIGWFDDDPVVIAHNAAFDRGMFEARFQGLDSLRWACSVKDVDWRGLGFESSKLEFLLLKMGYFYEGHRASIDALATAFLLHIHPSAGNQLLESESVARVKLEAVGCPFECKDSLKARGYRWNPDNKVWHIEIDQGHLSEELAMLSQLYERGGDRARQTVLGSRDRYKAV